MSKLPSFLVQLLSVIAGVALLVMTTAFVMLPYSLLSHPGEIPSGAVSRTFHPT